MPHAEERAAAGLSVFFPADSDSGTIASLVITAVRAAERLTRCTASSPDHTVTLLFGLKLGDVDCDFRLVRRSVDEYW